jgi:hypothetical protein
LNTSIRQSCFNIANLLSSVYSQSSCSKNLPKSTLVRIYELLIKQKRRTAALFLRREAEHSPEVCIEMTRQKHCRIIHLKMPQEEHRQTGEESRSEPWIDRESRTTALFLRREAENSPEVCIEMTRQKHRRIIHLKMPQEEHRQTGEESRGEPLIESRQIREAFSVRVAFMY